MDFIDWVEWSKEMSIDKSYYRQIDNILYEKKSLYNGNEVYKIVNEEILEVQ